MNQVSRFRYRLLLRETHAAELGPLGLRASRLARMHKVDREGCRPGGTPDGIVLGNRPKETFHAFLLSDRGDAKKVFPNTPKGFEQLTTWLENRHGTDVHTCMEATAIRRKLRLTRNTVSFPYAAARDRY